MKLDNRLSKLEREFKANSKYRGCELIQLIDANEPVKFYCQHPDGRKEEITDNKVLNKLKEVDNEEIKIEIVENDWHIY